MTNRNKKVNQSRSCITGKEKDGQNVSRIINQILKLTKKESDITSWQKSVTKGFNIVIQQSSQWGNTIPSLSVSEELVRPELVSQEEDQNVSASRDGGNQNGIKESINAYQNNHNHHMDSAICQESRNDVEAQQPWMTVQQLIDTVQHELTAGYVTGKLN